MIDPKALEKLVKNGVSIVSFKDGDCHSARMILDARVEPDGRVSFEISRNSHLAGYLKKTNAFTLSVLMEGGRRETYIDLLQRFDTDYYDYRDKFFGLKCIEFDQNGLYGVTDCTNAIISCKIDRVVQKEETCCVFGIVVESRLLHDNSSLTEDVCERTLKCYSVSQCKWCGRDYYLSSDETCCAYCGGPLYLYPWKNYQD